MQIKINKSDSIEELKNGRAGRHRNEIEVISDYSSYSNYYLVSTVSVGTQPGLSASSVKHSIEKGENASVS